MDLVQFAVETASDVQRAVEDVLATRTSIGHPTLEVKLVDGTSLSLSTDGERAFLVCIDSDGASHSSVGGPPQGAVLVFDYRGSWSEAGSGSTVPLSVAVRALGEFVERGAVPPDLLGFEAD